MLDGVSVFLPSVAAVSAHMKVFQEINFGLYKVSLKQPESSHNFSSQTHLDHPQFAFWHINQLDLFDSHSLAGSPVEGLVDRPKSSLSDAITESLEHPRVWS